MDSAMPEGVLMTPVAPDSPRQELVLLEPRNRADLDVERNALIADIERELPAEIVSPREYSAAAAIEERLNVFLKRVEPVFDEHCNGAYKVWKSACAIRSLFLDGPQALYKRVRRLRGEYEHKEEATRRERERQIAEEETRKERDRLAREARLLDKQGQKDMAAAVRATPVVAPAVSLPSAVPAVSGVNTLRRNWSWRIAGCTDLYGGRKDKDARKRAAKLVPREFLDLDEAAITAHVKAQRSSARIPGIEVYEEKV
jgi:hypothetical protein